MKKSLERWAKVCPKMVAMSSEAHIAYLVSDAQADIAELAALLRSCAADLEDWRMSFPEANTTLTDGLLASVNALLSDEVAQCSACACGRTDPHAQTLACIKAAGDAMRNSGSIRSMLESLDAPGAVFGEPATGSDGELTHD